MATSTIKKDIDSVAEVLAGVTTYNGDCDNLPIGVVYASNTATHIPKGWCIILTMANTSGGSVKVQLALCSVSFNAYYRYYNANTWSAWKEFTLAT